MAIIRATISHRKMEFIRPAGTSRGVLNDKDAYFIHLYDESENEGIGECSIIKGLSIDDREDYLDCLNDVVDRPEYYLTHIDVICEFPSIVFGLETAYQNLLQKKEGLYYPSDFTLGKAGIPINGLIWMGDENNMIQQGEEKMAQGFTCVKLKIGGIDFDSECRVLERVRKKLTFPKIELRVDANGSFDIDNAMEYLDFLSKYDLHSIEQPIAAGQYEYMQQLSLHSPIPIALDEELIGIFTKEEKEAMLDTIKPQFIVLKPSLHGGISGCTEWIELANQRNIQWWITSALESNIGLNAIAQWTATLNSSMFQGLGTGLLFANNFDSNLVIEKGKLWFRP